MSGWRLLVATGQSADDSVGVRADVRLTTHRTQLSRAHDSRRSGAKRRQASLPSHAHGYAALRPQPSTSSHHTQRAHTGETTQRRGATLSVTRRVIAQSAALHQMLQIDDGIGLSDDSAHAGWAPTPTVSSHTAETHPNAAERRSPKGAEPTHSPARPCSRSRG